MTNYKASPQIVKDDTRKKNKDIVDLCTRFGFKVRRMNSGKIHVGKRWINLGEEDWPDIFGFHTRTGRVIAVETKKVGEKITEGQQAFLDLVERAGGIAMIAYDVESVAERLAMEDRILRKALKAK